MDKKKRIGIGLAALTAAVVLGVCIFFMTHVVIDGSVFSKNAEVLDLTGHALTAEEYQALCRQYPQKQILWQVPFQGNRYPMDTESVTVTVLTEEDARSLDLMENLKLVDGTGCTDYAAMLWLQQHRPDCTVLYSVDIGGTACDSQTEELTLENADAAALQNALPLLPRLHTVHLTGQVPQPEQLLQLQSAFPGVQFRFTLTCAGQEVSSEAQSLELTGAEVDLEELSRILPVLPQIQTVSIPETVLTAQEGIALHTQFPQVFFRCQVEFAGMPFPTDSQQIDVSGCPITAEEAEALLPLFPELIKLDLSYCGIDDETMDALNRRYPDTAIVWTMQIGRATVRTDDTIFYPARINEYDLPSNEELQKLRYCTEMVAIDIGHSKATDCEWVRYMPHLKFLILADTQITDLSPLSEAKELIYLELFTMNLTDYSPLLGCTALQDLNIGSTYADPEPLSKMTWLHNLSWHGILEDPELSERATLLVEQLPDTNVVLETWRNIGGIWRFLPNYYVFRELLDAKFFNQEYVNVFWDAKESKRVLATDNSDDVFAADVLAEIVRHHIDNGLPIVGVKNIGSEKAEILYQSLCAIEP